MQLKKVIEFGKAYVKYHLRNMNITLGPFDKVGGSPVWQNKLQIFMTLLQEIRMS